MGVARENRRRGALARAVRLDSTPAERALWALLRDRRLAGLKFRRQQPCGRFVVDFYCKELGLVVEADGPIHLDERARDRERDAWLKSHGLTVLRLSNEDILAHTLRVRLEILRAALRASSQGRGVRHPLPLRGRGPG